MSVEHVNVAAYLDDVAASQPDALAVAVANGRGGFTELTCAALAARCDRMARALEGVGVKRGTRVALMVTPSPAFFALTFALFRIGAVPVMVDPGMGIKNLGACLKEAAPEVFIGVPKAQLARMLLGWGRGAVQTVITVGPRPLWRGLSLEALEAAAPEERSTPAPVAPDDLAAILFTSGSTGVPKGAEYTYGIFAAQVRLLRDTYGIAPGEVDLSTFPLFALFSPALGMASIVPEMDASRPGRANPARLFEAITRYSCTNVFANPALIDKLGRYGEERGIKLTTVRRVLSAGAPASVPALRRFVTMLSPGAEVHTPYGATEALPVATVGSDTILGETAAATAQGRGVCVGHPASEVEVAIIAVEDGPISTWSDDLSLPQGEIGEIVVKGPMVTRRYFRRDAATALAKIADGDAVRHRMGDVGWIDDQGRLWMCGRKAHRVETGQERLYTLPCEAIFNAHPKVFRTALVGVPRPPGRIQPVLWVELEPQHKGADKAALEAELRALGAAADHTRPIQTFLFHTAFPVDVRHNAKIFRERLALEAAQRLR